MHAGGGGTACQCLSDACEARQRPREQWHNGSIRPAPGKAATQGAGTQPDTAAASRITPPGACKGSVIVAAVPRQQDTSA